MYIDLNCDLGEGFATYTVGDETEIMKNISSVNIACGFHAGDPLIMKKTVQSAMNYGVSVGAHPGFNDIEGFGRTFIALSNEQIQAEIIYQIGALKVITESSGGKLQHVKIHGAMYNKAAVDYNYARIISDAVFSVQNDLIFMGLADSVMLKAAEDAGLKTAHEVFADRAYTDEGKLVPRSEPGALIDDIDVCCDRMINLIRTGTIETITGKQVRLNADTICFHGDSAYAPVMAKSLSDSLKKAGISVTSFLNTQDHV